MSSLYDSHTDEDDEEEDKDDDDDEVEVFEPKTEDVKCFFAT